MLFESGLPHFNNALEMPCTDKAKAEGEIARLLSLWEERQARNATIDRTGKGWAMLIDNTPRPRFEIREVG